MQIAEKTVLITSANRGIGEALVKEAFNRGAKRVFAGSREAFRNTAAVFDARFSRCYRLLHFIACRVLGGPERADDAIKNCWLSVSRNPPLVEYGGEFRAWLIRVLIDEALAILGESQGSAQRNWPSNEIFPARNQFDENETVRLKAPAEGEY